MKNSGFFVLSFLSFTQSRKSCVSYCCISFGSGMGLYVESQEAQNRLGNLAGCRQDWHEKTLCSWCPWL